MLQSIQYVGSGPATYVFSENAVGSSNAFYHVFATETSGYKSRRDRKGEETSLSKRGIAHEGQEQEEFKVLEGSSLENLQEVYQKEYGKRESFLWKQK